MATEAEKALHGRETTTEEEEELATASGKCIWIETENRQRDKAVIRATTSKWSCKEEKGGPSFPKHNFVRPQPPPSWQNLKQFKK